MSKIICDVCGSSYPETSTQCPVCGCVRPADSVAVPENSRDNDGYTYIRGGRFSKSNVKKRSKKAAVAAQSEKKPVNKKILGLVIVLVCLVLIVALLLVFILIGFSDTLNQGQSSTTSPQTNSQEIPEEIPCTQIKLSQVDFTMTKVGEAVILDASVLPEETTDTVRFESTNPDVVTVDEQSGKVLCIGPGKAEIKVTCGEMIAVCRVTCEIEPVSSETSAPEVTVNLMRKKIDDANYEGKFFNLYNDQDSTVPAEELTWISDDPKVATVNQSGRVTAVGEGSTTIRVEYNGVTVASCEIICNFEVPDNGEESPEGGDPGTNGAGPLVPYSHYGSALPFEKDMNAYSVTLSEGEWLGIFLRDPNNPSHTVEVHWEWDETYGGGCTIDEDGAGVTATSDEITRIVAKYGSTYYYIIIR